MMLQNNHDDRPREILTVAEVAELLRLGRTSAYELCQQPDFPALRIGRGIRIPRAALDRWLMGRGGSPMDFHN